jgi:hypothetical protein
MSDEHTPTLQDIAAADCDQNRTAPFAADSDPLDPYRGFAASALEGFEPTVSPPSVTTRSTRHPQKVRFAIDSAGGKRIWACGAARTQAFSTISDGVLSLQGAVKRWIGGQFFEPIRSPDTIGATSCMKHSIDWSSWSRLRLPWKLIWKASRPAFSQ